MARLIEQVRAVAFDLDGTLVDTAADLAAAANGMLEAMGHAPLSERHVRMRIGNGVERLVEALLQDSTGNVASAGLAPALELFDAHYTRHLSERSRTYTGVPECLGALRGMGIPLACVTNKHSRFAVPLLDALRLKTFFGTVLCADRAEQRKPNPALLHAACAFAGVAPRELLFVGDSCVDIAAARAAGCPVAVVDYGYNADAPLAAGEPDWMVSSLTEILTLPGRRSLAHATA